jgi:hypothetical protein
METKEMIRYQELLVDDALANLQLFEKPKFSSASRVGQ